MGDIWTMLYQDKHEAHLSLQGKALVFVSRQMERLLPSFHKKRCFYSLQETHKGARGKLWKSRVMQPFCLCGSERLGWRIVLSISLSIFPNGLDGDRNLFQSLASNPFEITILNQPKVGKNLSEFREIFAISWISPTKLHSWNDVTWRQKNVSPSWRRKSCSFHPSLQMSFCCWPSTCPYPHQSHHQHLQKHYRFGHDVRESPSSGIPATKPTTSTKLILALLLIFWRAMWDNLKMIGKKRVKKPTLPNILQVSSVLQMVLDLMI